MVEKQEEYLRCGLECGQYNVIDHSSGNCLSLGRQIADQYADEDIVHLGDRCHLGYKKPTILEVHLAHKNCPNN